MIMIMIMIMIGIHSRNEISGASFCGSVHLWVCHRAGFDPLVLCDGIVHPKWAAYSHFRGSLHQLVGKLLGRAPLLSFTAGPRSICVHHLHSHPNLLHNLRLEGGS